MDKSQVQYAVILVFFLAVGVLVWTTQAPIWIALWVVGLVIVGLGVTGVLGSLWAWITGDNK